MANCLVRNTIREMLWSEEKGACYDRDCDGKRMDILIHNNLRCMYYGSFSQEMADRFVREHLLNPQEFWTRVPLPSIAANDPCFENINFNNLGWSIAGTDVPAGDPGAPELRPSCRNTAAGGACWQCDL